MLACGEACLADLRTDLGHSRRLDDDVDVELRQHGGVHERCTRVTRDGVDRTIGVGHRRGVAGGAHGRERTVRVVVDDGREVHAVDATDLCGEAATHLAGADERDTHRTTETLRMCGELLETGHRSGRGDEAGAVSPGTRGGCGL